MALSTTQLATLKAAIIADPVAGPIRAAGDTVSLLAWCNGASATRAWRASVPPQDSDEAPDYTLFDAIVAGKRASWGFFLGFPRDFTRAKVRRWVTDVWGAAIAGSSSEAILLAGTAFATNAQLALGGVNRSTGTVAALDRSYSELVTQTEANLLVN